MDRDLRRSAVVSFIIHATIIAVAIVTLPIKPLQSSADVSVDVTLVGPSQPQTSQNKGQVAAASDQPVAHQGPVNPNHPKPQPIVAPPPPPPPPPPAPVQKPLPTPPAPPPPIPQQPQTNTPTPPPPPPVPQQTQTSAPKAPPPPPPKPVPTPLPAPPPPPPRPPQKQQSQAKPSTAKVEEVKHPPVPQHEPQKQQSQAKPSTTKTEETKQPPAPSKSATHQQHDVKSPLPLSQNVLNTLSQLRVNQKQEKAPTSQYNPDQGGAPHGGGSPNSTANSALNEADRSAIGAHVRPCWGIDAGAPGVSTFSVQLLVTTDATGTVREAHIAPASEGNMGNPVYAAFAQRAVAAVENYQCATLPLPSNMLGSVHTFLFNFTP